MIEIITRDEAFMCEFIAKYDRREPFRFMDRYWLIDGYDLRSYNDGWTLRATLKEVLYAGQGSVAGPAVSPVVEGPRTPEPKALARPAVGGDSTNDVYERALDWDDWEPTGL